ncbi:hypothetical protein N9M10_03875, partial [Hellea sp.]|nr:hypothetical protein [Hellea sp.]
MSDKYRQLPKFLSDDGDEKVKVRNNGKVFTKLKPKSKTVCTPEVDRRHTKFLQLLVSEFGKEPFRRLDLDAGRLGWLL